MVIFFYIKKKNKNIGKIKKLWKVSRIVPSKTSSTRNVVSKKYNSILVKSIYFFSSRNKIAFYKFNISATSIESRPRSNDWLHFCNYNFMKKSKGVLLPGS